MPQICVSRRAGTINDQGPRETYRRVYVFSVQRVPGCTGAGKRRQGMRLWGIRLNDRGFPFFGQEFFELRKASLSSIQPDPMSSPIRTLPDDTTTIRFAGRPSILRPPRIDPHGLRPS
jgi:hypothetical protein